MSAKRESIEIDPSKRRTEIARIFARGVLRRKQHLRRMSQIFRESPGGNPASGLEVLADTSVTVDVAAG